ncbi:glycosyltransferase family 2 protein [Mangrovimonas sp. YM274]|uniref:glycosyltransferase family 2 protein n=1 Tax=Mangrovimonas sp. YM274 TaxID=3070660 RepID=UPI0027DE1DE9|nr:glycosyltransferase family 2 protein [Mangrovimonas sp. YM274]WMI68459.1 glycosyltransferase family 2 protein [Mangrovimonas sp. YM274]
MKILTIIVTYNGAKWVDRCFSSLQDSSIAVDVLVIDNGSTDNTVSLIKGKFPKVKVIEPSENLGFGKANNIGLKRVLEKNYDFAFLLNQDAWIERDTLCKLIDVYNSVKTEDVGILSPLHLSGSGTSIDRGFQNYLSGNNTPHFLSDLYLNNLKPYYKSGFVNAAAWLLPRICIEQIGGFDPIFEMYGEDDDFYARVKRAGMEVFVVSQSRIYHDRPQVRKDKNRNYLKNEILKGAVLQLKKNKFKKSFLYRRILVNTIMLKFVYANNHKELDKQVKIDKLSLKLFDKVDGDGGKLKV